MKDDSLHCRVNEELTILSVMLCVCEVAQSFQPLEKKFMVRRLVCNLGVPIYDENIVILPYLTRQCLFFLNSSCGFLMKTPN